MKTTTGLVRRAMVVAAIVAAGIVRPAWAPTAAQMPAEEEAAVQGARAAFTSALTGLQVGDRR